MSGSELDNITPLRPKLKPKAQHILSRIECAADLPPVIDRDYIIKGWLDRGAVSVLYGDANAGKSFLAIDIAHHVHQGATWAGARVRPSPVLYVAAEGGAMFANRLAARRAGFMVLRGALRLSGKTNDADPLAETINHLSEVQGPFGLIVIDTLARVMGGADENAAPDIGSLVASLDTLAETTGAHVMVVHHTGKDASKGARGHSSLRAAIDTEIEVAKDQDGTRTARVTKQRDMPTGNEARFELEVVELGKDSDGDAVTSCIVKHEGGRLI